uniref:Ion_trans_2 domain-containing protein n=1 Tax=Heterorhabditis bacteriophora TaxID=37862 RepID=A0A1I7XMQ3_HETBA
MPPKDQRKVEKGRSKSADNRWSVVNKGIHSVVSRSLPVINRKKENEKQEKKERKKRRRRKKQEDNEVESPPQQEVPRPRIIIAKEDKRHKTLWRHIMWLVVLFAYSLLGGIIFSAIESNRPLRELDIVLPDEEQTQTVPIKAALIFFFLWISLSALIVRLWEYEWSYFSAFYFFFTSLTTIEIAEIGLGDVVTKTPNFIIFNLALTLMGLSVVGLCLAIVQAKVRLVFDRLFRSIDSQYRIKQIDPDVATMTLIPDEEEGVKRLISAQPLQDRIVYIFMDEHRKCMLRERWRQKSGMINKIKSSLTVLFRITQTYPSRAEKYVQTGNRVYDQPFSDDDNWEEEDESEEESDVEYDEAGNRVVLPSTKRYIYTVFD